MSHDFDLDISELESTELGQLFPNHKRKILYGFFENFNSQHTRKKLKEDLFLFISFLNTHFPGLSLLKIDHDHMTAFKNYLDQLPALKNRKSKNPGKRYTKESVNRKLTSVSSFYLYLGRRGLVDKNPLQFLKRHRFHPTHKTLDLSDEEVIKILQQVDTQTLSGKMHYAILMVFLGTGMRHSELRFLQKKNFFKMNKYWVLRFLSKNEKERLSPLSDKCANALMDYLEAKEKDNLEKNKRILSEEEYLFVPTINHSKHPLALAKGLKGPLSPSTIDEIVKKYAFLAGIKRSIGPHSFRATAIGNLLENGVDLGEVSEWVGHSNVNTTKKYSKRKSSIDKSPGLSLSYF